MDAPIGKIAAFLGIELTSEKLKDIKEKVGFTSMQSSEYSGLGDVKELNKFFRKGEAGSWKDYFTVRQNEWFDELCEGRLAGSGVPFDGDDAQHMNKQENL